MASDASGNGGDGNGDDLVVLVENLRKKLDSLPVIEQAKGILMDRKHCTADEAFAILKRASMHRNRKLRDVAADIVEATIRGRSRRSA